MKKIRACVRCGSPLSHRNSRRFCSWKCFQLDLKENPRPSSAIEIKCQVCGRPIFVTASGIRANRKFCSYRCLGIGKRREVSVVCQKCGKQFTKKVSRSRRFCSAACSRAVRGKEHHNWQGGRIKSRGPDWSQQRRLAIKRDRGRCQRCGGKGNQVDHILPFAYVLMLRRSGITDKSPNDLANLMTLCATCHGMKRGAERRLMMGNVLDFRKEVLRLYGIEAIAAEILKIGTATKVLDKKEPPTQHTGETTDGDSPGTRPAS